MKFSADDYNSNDGFQTSVWGPLLWTLLHIISFNYPVKPTQEQKVHYYNFLLSLRNVLPCVYCRNNFYDNLRSCNFSEKVFTNRDTFSTFIHDLHNQVNIMLGKECTDALEDVRDTYEHFRSYNCSASKKTEGEAGCEDPRPKCGKSRCKVVVMSGDSNKVGDLESFGRSWLLEKDSPINERVTQMSTTDAKSAPVDTETQLSFAPDRNPIVNTMFARMCRVRDDHLV